MNTIQQSVVSIAVLPFLNISTTNELNYFAMGFVEDLITDLSKYSSIQVISQQTTAQVHNKGQISALNPDFLVKGSFRQMGKELKINVQLILTSNQSVLWSHRYQAQIDELFEIQDDVTEQIVSALQREIDANLLSVSKRKPPANLAAYEYWLMGMEELKKANVDADNNARQLFQHALNLDPQYARAWAGLSMSYFNEWSCQLWERWDYSQKGAYEYALKAVELDDSNYISMTVLGRLYVYKGEWEKAEHYLRKSLRLNSNDTDNLIQIASCFVHMKYLKEAEKLFLKALKLNPVNTNWYYSHGGMLYFEMGEYEKSLEHGLKANLENVMVDMSVYISGSYYYLGQFDKMSEYWAKYRNMFERKIMRGNPASVEDAIRWAKSVNPSKGKSNTEAFLEFIATRQEMDDYSLQAKVPDVMPVGNNYFRKSGTLWEMRYNGEKVLMAELKGFKDIYKLISQPTKEFHCSELMEIPVLVGEDDQMFDQKAKNKYKTRLVQLQEDIEEAQEMNDNVRAGHLQEEYDKILDHLSSSLGLGGKTRKLDDQIDKARSALTWRIRTAIKKIRESHICLGNHLSNSIRTGIFCSYTPETETKWNE